MIIKLQCMNEVVAEVAHQHWPDNTVLLGSALICIHLSSYDLATLQQRTCAFTVELTASDEQLVDDLKMS